MADPDDFSYAISDATDLVGCVLDGADFSGRNLSGKDFRKSNVQKANFTNCNLTNCDFRGAQMAHANFSGAVFDGAKFNGSIFGVKFVGSDLRGATFQGLFTRCDLSNANLSGTNFLGSRFTEGCKFEGAIADSHTKFDGVAVLRPYAKLPVFNGYRFERGALHKEVLGQREHEANTKDLIGEPHQQLKAAALLQIDSALKQLKGVSTFPDATSVSMIGHNSPPEEFLIRSEDKQNAIEAMEQAKETISSEEPNKSVLESCVRWLGDISVSALKWSAEKADLLAEEFAKSVGKTLGSKTAFFVSTALLTQDLSKAMDLVSQLIDAIF